MVRTTHSLRQWILTVALLLVASQANGTCISPTLTPTECDFKDEDTLLWYLQPAWKLSSNHRIDTLLENARQSVDQYLSSVKTIGDDAIRQHLQLMTDGVSDAILAAEANLGSYTANDPWNLKPIYLDITRCVPFWYLVGESCPTTADLPVDFERIEQLKNAQAELVALLDNPALFLGEEWGAIAEDFAAIRGEFDRTQTLARHLDPVQRVQQFRERFKDYETKISEPALTLERWSEERQVISETLHDTLIDTMKATQRIGYQQLHKDRNEIFRLSDMNRDAVGRMQAFETSNMMQNQTAQVWLKLTEQYMNMGNLMALDMSEQAEKTGTAIAKDTHAVRTDRLRETIVGNEQALPLP